jgi:hypothetical protein
MKLGRTVPASSPPAARAAGAAAATPRPITSANRPRRPHHQPDPRQGAPRQSRLSVRVASASSATEADGAPKEDARIRVRAPLSILFFSSLFSFSYSISFCSFVPSLYMHHTATVS